MIVRLSNGGGTDRTDEIPVAGAKLHVRNGSVHVADVDGEVVARHYAGRGWFRVRDEVPVGGFYATCEVMPMRKALRFS